MDRVPIMNAQFFREGAQIVVDIVLDRGGDVVDEASDRVMRT